MFDRNKMTTGMVVRSYDGDKLGKITSIDNSGFMVEKGIFFPKDYRVSFDQVDELKDNDLYLKWGTQLIEGKYDEVYGSGSYDRDTSDTNVWKEHAFTSGKTTSGEWGTQGKSVDVPLRGEEPQVERKGMREKGRVRIVKTVRTEDKTFTVPLRREEVRIERVPLNESSAAHLNTNESGPIEQQTVDIPLKQEEVEISKRTVAKEAIRATTESKTVETPVQSTVRKEEAHIEREGADLEPGFNKKKAG